MERVVSTLRDYIEKLERVADGGLTSSIAREVAVEGLKVIDQGFATETDPYGNRWRPLKEPARKHGAGILDDTGVMRRAFFAFPAGTSVRFVNNSVQACAQNYGRSEVNLPSRRMLPDIKMGLGFKWTAMLDRVVKRQMREAFTP
jgi:hypothetical protein